MPEYLYQNQETKEIRSVVQTMSEKHEYFGESGGEKWNRVFINPQMNFDSLSKLDPFSSKDFKKYTENKNIKYGDMLDASKELGEKRAQKNGRDDFKEKYLDDYEKRVHAKHPERMKKSIENEGIRITDLNKTD